MAKLERFIADEVDETTTDRGQPTDEERLARSLEQGRIFLEEIEGRLMKMLDDVIEKRQRDLNEALRP